LGLESFVLLQRNKVNFNKKALRDMFTEADFKGKGFLTGAEVLACATGRYPKRKFGALEWAQAMAYALSVPLHRMDPAMDLVEDSASVALLTMWRGANASGSAGLGDAPPALTELFPTWSPGDTEGARTVRGRDPAMGSARERGWGADNRARGAGPSPRGRGGSLAR